MTTGPARRGRLLAAASSLVLFVVTAGLAFTLEAEPATATASPPATSPETPPAASTAVVSPAGGDALAFEDGASGESAPEDAAPAPPPAPDTDPCTDALAWVGETGLRLPAGVDYRCPSTRFAHQGTACWYNVDHCSGGGRIFINMDLLHGASTEYLRHVVAHEVCHILEFQAAGRTTEASAEACAAAHGAPA